MSTSRPRILVVEDENVVSMDLRESLGQLSYLVSDCVRSGRQAMESVQRDPPALVLMDIQLPGELDGIETADLIRKTFDIPVVYVTAYSDPVTLRRAQVSEPFGYLLKPFDERELQVVIEMSLFRHQAQKEHEKLLAEQAARVAIEQEHRWVQFLAEAGERLSSSLDLDETLASVARLAVPVLADWVLVRLHDSETARPVVVQHTAGREALFRDLLRRYPPHSPLRVGYPLVFSAGGSGLLPSVGDDVLVASAVDAEHLRLLRELCLQSYISVPLVMRGQTFGALSLATAESGRVYGPRDLDRAREVARRCASAIDNARLYQKAQQAITLREDFLSVASHELRTPLTSLLLTVESMEGLVHRIDNDLLQRRFKVVVERSDFLIDLVDRLLDVSRIAAGKLELRLTEVDLVQLVSKVASRFEEDVRRAGSTLELRLPPPIVGHWDGLRLEQVLTNVLGNAIKFCARKPIEVVLEGDDKLVSLTVRDRGIGIPPEKLPHVFERFERGVSSINYGGLGLGLYVARQLVEAHGGLIQVESESGNGATFVIELPRHPRSASP